MHLKQFPAIAPNVSFFDILYSDYEWYSYYVLQNVSFGPCKIFVITHLCLVQSEDIKMYGRIHPPVDRNVFIFFCVCVCVCVCAFLRAECLSHLLKKKYVRYPYDAVLKY